MILALPMGALIAFPLLLQLFTLRHWKFWVAALHRARTGHRGVLLHVLNG